MSQRPVGHPPALVERADEVLGGHPGVVEEDLVEVQVVLIACGRERASDDPREVSRDHQGADALVFGRVWISANKSEQHVGVVGSGRPHLLPVDHEAVPVAVGTGAQRSQIGAGTGLAHAKRRRQLGAQDRHRPPPLLLRRSERDQRRGDDADALRVEREIDASAGQLLLMDILLQQRGVSPTELRWVSGQQPAVVEHQPLPAARPSRDMAARSRPLQRLRLRRQVLVEEGHELCAEGLDVSVEGQLHGAPGEENSKDYCYLQNENTILMMRKLQSLTREPRGGRGPQWQGVLRYSQCMFSLIGLDPSRR